MLAMMQMLLYSDEVIMVGLHVLVREVLYFCVDDVVVVVVVLIIYFCGAVRFNELYI